MKKIILFSLLYAQLLISTCVFSTQALDSFRSIEKNELHLHLGGAWPLQFIESIADAQLTQELHLHLDALNNGLNYEEAFAVFNCLSKAVNTEQRIEDGVVALCAELIADGVTYVELRTGPRDLGNGLEGYLQAVLRGIKRGCSGNCLTVAVILSIRRDTPTHAVHAVLDLIEKYKEDVVGLDISGVSTIGNGAGIFDALERIKRLCIPITLHIGESAQESAEQQIKELTLLNPQRVGHCVHLCKEAQEIIRDKHIPIEMCLSSAVKTRMINTVEEHPALQMLKEGYPVAICTDDPLIFNTTLSQESLLVAQAAQLSSQAIASIHRNSYAFRFRTSDLAAPMS